jgi:uncharacterized coiled-coil protein SlyX
MEQYLPIIFGTIGGFLISLLTIWLAFRRLPLELRGMDASIANAAYDLAEKAIKNRREDAVRIDALEKSNDEQTRINTEMNNTVKEMKGTIREDAKIIEQKNAQIRELTRKNMDYEQRIQGLEALVTTHERTIAELQRKITDLQNGVKIVKKTTDELKRKENS